MSQKEKLDFIDPNQFLHFFGVHWYFASYIYHFSSFTVLLGIFQKSVKKGAHISDLRTIELGIIDPG